MIEPTTQADANDIELQRSAREAEDRQLELERQHTVELERQRAETQAEWDRIRAGREELEHARQQFEAERAAQLAPAAPSRSISAVSEPDAPDWLHAIPDPDRAVFRHLAEHGAINETEATRLLGGARQFRRFSGQLEAYLALAPFTVRIEMSGGIKCYVRAGKDPE